MWFFLLFSIKLLTCLHALENGNSRIEQTTFTYICKEGQCNKEIYNQSLEEPKLSLQTCAVLCKLSVWPLPTKQYTVNGLFKFCPRDVSLNFDERSSNYSELEPMRKEFMSSLADAIPKKVTCHQNKKLNIVGLHGSLIPSKNFLDSVDGYEIRATATQGSMNVELKYWSIFGAQYALRTLRQLFTLDGDEQCMLMPSQVTILDEPAHKYRGVLLDTSRQFIPLDEIKKLIDVMGSYKMNVFHWHITDSHSFPFQSERVQQMSEYGAYGSREVYTVDEVADLKKFAAAHGVHLLIEIDMPAHAGYGWQWGPEFNRGDLALCVGQSPWENYCLQPPCGQLNPINNYTHEILQVLFEELLNITREPIFHIGGDEVKFECWNESAAIREYLVNRTLNPDDEGFHILFGEFMIRARDSVNAAYKKVTGSSETVTSFYWSSSLTGGDYLKKYIDPLQSVITYWDSLAQIEYLKHLLENNYRLVMVNHDHSYLDCGYPHYVNDGHIWCNPYKSWQDVYNNDYKTAFKNANIFYKPEQILGGQVALWTEVASPLTFMSKMLPRIVAASERWWTYPSTDSSQARQRFHLQQNLLSKNSALRTQATAPEFCLQNPRMCYDRI